MPGDPPPDKTLPGNLPPVEKVTVIEDRGADTLLCALDDIADPGGIGLRVAGRDPLFVVRRGDQVWGYVNACAHQGVNLDWRPDTFLSRDKQHILCAMHGALFHIESGLCVFGPCLDRSLKPVKVRLAAGQVMLVE